MIDLNEIINSFCLMKACHLARRLAVRGGAVLLTGSGAFAWCSADATAEGDCPPPLVQRKLTSVSRNLRTEEWRADGPLVIGGVPWSVSKTTLHGGRQEGVDEITVDNGLLSFTVIPTRGMSIGRLTCHESTGAVPLGWESPVRETVHPSHVELNDRGGLGWLTGFNEWLVRCGVAFAGHPGKDGDHLLTLHGRIGNIPASEVEVVVGAPRNASNSPPCHPLLCAAVAPVPPHLLPCAQMRHRLTGSVCAAVWTKLCLSSPTLSYGLKCRPYRAAMRSE